MTKQFNSELFPKTFAYVLKNDTGVRRCNKCGAVVLKEPSIPEYPYQCIMCDENLYEIETHLGKFHSEKEVNDICCAVRDILLLDA